MDDHQKQPGKPLFKGVYSLLRWTEKYLKTDMIYIAKNGSWLTLGQGASSLVSLLLALSFAHLVPKEIYGNYKYILSLGSIFAAFSLTGVGTALVRSIAKGYDGTLRYDFWLNIKWSLVIFLGSLGSSVYYFIQQNSVLGISFLIIGSFSPFLTSASLHGTYLSGKKDFRRTSLFNIFKRLIPATLLLVTMILSQNVIVLVLVYFIANTAVTLYFYFLTLRIYQIPLNAPVDPDNLSYAKHLSFMGILGGIADRIDSILVFHYLGAVSLSIYAFSTAIPEQIIGWVKNINTLALPKFAARDKEHVQRELAGKILRLFLVLSAIYVVYYIGAPYIYKYFFPQYIDSVGYSQLYALMLILTSSTITMSFLQSHKAIRENYIINISSSVMRIVLVSVLVINYGITGAIAGQLLAKLCASILSYSLARKF